MRKVIGLFGFSGAIALIAVACSASNGSAEFGQGGGDSTTAATGTGTSQGGSTGVGTGNGGDIGFDGGPTGSSGTGQPICNSTPDQDEDGDGFTGAMGDCNDCDVNVNPNAIDVIAVDGSGGGVPVAVDEDCDGTVDNLPLPCDDALDVADADPFNGARAVELCKVSSGPTDWGVVTATWVKPDGQPFGGPAFDLGHGLLSAFGPNVSVQAGARMLGLSSGTARQPTDPGYMSVGGYNKQYTSAHPQGFPKESPTCGVTVTGECHDGAGLDLKIRTPANAQGFSFDFNFYTYEWPVYVCSQFNDFFVAELVPWPMGQTDGNISFDSLGNPVSVNNAFLEACGCPSGPPCIAGGKSFSCLLGTQYLQGTGFTEFGTDHASTYWLSTKAPVAPNSEIVIRWSTYDSGDGSLDSTTLIDNWQWIATPGTEVGTDPIEDPR